MWIYYAFVAALVIIVTLLIRNEIAGNLRRMYLYKPLATLIVILIAGVSLLKPESTHLSYKSGIIAGLIFSLAGDIALMFKSARAFRYGMIFFLIAHIIYSVTFTAHSGFVTSDWISGLVLFLLAIVIYVYLYSGLRNMKWPVLFYVLIISFMTHRAISTFSGAYFALAQAWLIGVGAILFYLSDLILAINKFKRPLKYNRLSLAFYYAGQLLIALSTGLF